MISAQRLIRNVTQKSSVLPTGKAKIAIWKMEMLIVWINRDVILQKGVLPEEPLGSVHQLILWVIFIVSLKPFQNFVMLLFNVQKSLARFIAKPMLIASHCRVTQIGSVFHMAV